MNAVMVQLDQMRRRWADRDPGLPLPFARMPGWARKDPRLADPRTHWDRFQQTARVVWGANFMANNALYEPQDDQAPGLWCWSPDPEVDAEPALLDEAVRWFWHFREDGADIPGARAFAQQARNDMSRPVRQEVPHILTGGRLVYSETLLIDPAHLPHHRLANAYLPLLVGATGGVQGATQLPLPFWAPALVADW